MKLSEMSNDRVFNVLTVAAAELEPILSDEKIMTLSVDMKPKKDEAQLDYGIRIGKLMLSVIVTFSNTHRQRIYRVLAELYGCTADEIAQKPFGDTLKTLEDTLKDEVMLSFFSSLIGSGRKP